MLDDAQAEGLFGTDDAAEQALEFLRDALDGGFYGAGFTTMMEEEARNEFQSGNAVFMGDWPYAYELMTEEGQTEVADNFGIAPLPTFDGDGTVSALGGNSLAVSTFSENKEAATEFALFAATDPEAQAILARGAVPPSRRTTATSRSIRPSTPSAPTWSPSWAVERHRSRPSAFGSGGSAGQPVRTRDG